MQGQIDWGSDKDFILKYQELKSARKMGEFFNCNKTTVLNHAKKIGFDPNSITRNYKLSDEDKQHIIESYYTKTSTELASFYNVSRGMITAIWKKAGLKDKQRDYSNVGNNLIGQKFGYLTVIDYSDKRSSNGSKYWLCKCECGDPKCCKQKEVLGSSLLSKRVISCGTKGKENLQKGRGLNFEDLSGQQFGALTVIKRVENKVLSNNIQKVQYLCKCSCGRETIVLSDNLKTHNTQSCGFCKEKSHGNIKISKLLLEANIPFEREKRFKSCKDKNYLPFDFYVNNSFLIEYDGQQHYDENSFFNYKIIHKHDIIKSQWCKENNIPLIRIPYTHLENLTLQDLLLETSKFIEK